MGLGVYIETHVVHHVYCFITEKKVKIELGDSLEVFFCCEK